MKKLPAFWEAQAMTRTEVILRAVQGKLNWLQAADICGVSPRQMRRLRERYEQFGVEGLRDGRGRPRRERVPLATVDEVCRLKATVYPDFSVRQFHEHLTEQHGVRVSYTWTRLVLQAAGVVEKAPARGKHRRRRERRAARGMMLHIDGSTHEWIVGLPPRDLILVLDDADGRELYGQFFPQEGTRSTLTALHAVLRRYGRFAELYHDCGSHFGRTSRAGAGPDERQDGQVTRVLRALGIRQIFARSPQARGRSERAFGTVQQRLPPELRLAGIRDYDAANRFLDEVFWPDFNRRFTVAPACPESAFVPLVGFDLDLLLSIQHERVVRGDNTVAFANRALQIPPSPTRMHFVRCPVLVHEFLDGDLGISYQGRLLARYAADGQLREPPPPAAARRAARGAR